jgi:hypothetical protein
MSLDTVPIDTIQNIMMLCDIDSIINIYCVNNNFRKYVSKITIILANKWKLTPKHTFPELVALYDKKKISKRSQKYISLRKCAGRAASSGNEELFYYYYNKYEYDTAPNLYLLTRSMVSANSNIINHIISKNINLHLLGRYGLGRLFVKASKGGNIDLVKALYGEKEKLNVYKFDDISDFAITGNICCLHECIWKAAKHKHIDLYNWFVDKFTDKMDINDIDKAAAYFGDLSLLKKMNNINYERTITTAAKYNHKIVVEYLIERNIKEISTNIRGPWMGKIEFGVTCEKIFNTYGEIIIQLLKKYNYNADKILTTCYISKGMFDKINYYNHKHRGILISDAIKYHHNKKAMEWLKYELYQHELDDWEYTDIIECAIRYENYEIVRFFAEIPMYRVDVLNCGISLQDIKTVNMMFDEFPIKITNKLCKYLIDCTPYAHEEVAYYDVLDFNTGTAEIYKLYSPFIPTKYIYRIAASGRFDLLELFLERPELDYTKLAMNCLSCRSLNTVYNISHYNCLNLLLSKNKIKAFDFINFDLHPRIHRLFSLYIHDQRSDF